MNKFYSLSSPDFAYIFGFISTDGSLTKIGKKVRLAIELAHTDKEILEKFKTILPVKSFLGERIRKTNFKNKYKSSFLNCYNNELILKLNELGLFTGKKSFTITPPSIEYSEKDYWRGVIDGDGSLGFRTSKGKDGKPFIGLCSDSEPIVTSFSKLAYNISNSKLNPKRNIRDNIYNLSLEGEPAKLLVSYLYYDGCLALNRKKKLAELIKNWNPVNRNQIEWKQHEEEFVLNHSIEDSIKFTQRTKEAIQKRKWLLNTRTS